MTTTTLDHDIDVDLHDTGPADAPISFIDNGPHPADVSFHWLNVIDVHPAADNPRASLGDLAGLVDSIRAAGVLEPIVVTEATIGGGYTIVAGHRRHAAAKMAGHSTIPAIVRPFTTGQRIEAMVIENLQREDLTPFDEARGMRTLIDIGYTQRDIADRVGVSQGHVSKRLSLVPVPSAIEGLFVAGQLTVRMVEEIAKQPAEDLDEVAAQIVKAAEQYKTTLMPDWQLDQAIKRLADKRKVAKAEKAGAASGLTRLTDSYPSGQKWIECKRADATHWWLGGTSTKVTWFRARPKTTGEQAQRSPYESQFAANQRIAEKLVELCEKALTDAAFRQVWIDAGVASAQRQLIASGWAQLQSPRGHANPKVEEALTAQYIESPLFFIATAAINQKTDYSWKDRALLELFVANGYRPGDAEILPEGFTIPDVVDVEPAPAKTEAKAKPAVNKTPAPVKPAAKKTPAKKTAAKKAPAKKAPAKKAPAKKAIPAKKAAARK